MWILISGPLTHIPQFVFWLVLQAASLNGNVYITLTSQFDETTVRAPPQQRQTALITWRIFVFHHGKGSHVAPRGKRQYGWLIRQAPIRLTGASPTPQLWRNLTASMMGLQISLAVFNLLPCYPLDGGQLLATFLVSPTAPLPRVRSSSFHECGHPPFTRHHPRNVTSPYPQTNTETTRPQPLVLPLRSASCL